MGQKINPLGFRLGTTQSHHSLWFAQPKKYSEGLQEDKKKKRDCIKNYVQKNMRLSSGVEGIASGQLKNRVSFRKEMEKAIELTEQADTKGIQIQIARRIDGKEIATKVEYCSYRIRIIYGVLGIKIWIFIEEE
ncbi:hypothetical protein ES288_D04G033100v1 [Gossypium darwinii]|uniref:Small ribosomal subunit protein uS3 C-terminal domain-containing protein n=1 Tax=Gossypium darwinii TaxID=34276 RepID=A0A5D2CWH6_GOSDA|nr:hypothetical protein ES288_D04G033100v1 [Gossypium darwinii]